MISQEIVFLSVLFFIIAAIYSSVGFGGGSSYTATLAMLSVPYLVIPQISLLCNIIVVAGGSYIFFRKGFLDVKKIVSILIGSVPMAFIGGLVFIEREVYLFLLAVVLLLSSLKLSFFWRLNVKKESGESLSFKGFTQNKVSYFASVLIGGVVGFISGLVGIGGGILLSPLLHLIRWDEGRVISSTASFFILVNSISGLLGQILKNNFQVDFFYLLPLVASVFLGGQMGTRLGSTYFSEKVIRLSTAALVFIVSIRIFSVT